jgi:hypothetical protein
MKEDLRVMTIKLPLINGLFLIFLAMIFEMEAVKRC